MPLDEFHDDERLLAAIFNRVNRTDIGMVQCAGSPRFVEEAWRDKVKNAFEKREGEKLTFTPIFMEVVAKALREFPMMNIQVNGDYIIKKKSINLGT